MKLDVIPIPHKFEHNQRAVFERVERTVRPFVIDIAESETFLEKSLKQAKTGFRKERLQML